MGSGSITRKMAGQRCDGIALRKCALSSVKLFGDRVAHEFFFFFFNTNLKYRKDYILE